MKKPPEIQAAFSMFVIYKRKGRRLRPVAGRRDCGRTVPPRFLPNGNNVKYFSAIDKAENVCYTLDNKGTENPFRHFVDFSRYMLNHILPQPLIGQNGRLFFYPFNNHSNHENLNNKPSPVRMNHDYAPPERKCRN